MNIKNLVVIGDTHCGCKTGLCTPVVELDEGGKYLPSRLQKHLYRHWNKFWDEFVPDATRGEPYAVCHIGDAIDGVHHNSVSQITHNLTDQRKIAFELLEPVVQKCDGRYYHIRGTEAHVGKSGQEEEALAKQLGARRGRNGEYARYELWITIGGKLVHLLHHIGTTGSQAYEATAVNKELTEEFIEAGRWNKRRPDVIVRGHRHRFIEIDVPVKSKGKLDGRGKAIAVVTPAWQGKTPFTWKIPGARLAEPQFGGIVIRVSEGELFIRSCVWSLDRDRPE